MLKVQPGSGSRHKPRRVDTAVMRAALSVLSFCGMTAFLSLPVSGQERLKPVHLWVAGRVIPLTTSPVWTGRDTFIPLAALPAIGARGTLTPGRDVIRVRLRSGRTDSLPFVRRNGMAMISLTDLAETTDASVIRPSPNPTSGLKPNTAYLLAHISDVRLTGNELHVTTSFPVPFVSNSLNSGAARGYVDCIGATAVANFRPSRIPAGETRAEHIRVGQFAPDIARVVVDLAPGVTLEENSTEGKVTPTYIAALEGRSSLRNTHRTTRSSLEDNGKDNENGSERNIPERNGVNGSEKTGRRTRRSNPTETDSTEERPTSRSTERNDQLPPKSGASNTTTTTRRTADVRSITYETQDSQSIQIFIETSRKARAYVRYSSSTRQVIVDIPNSRLNLDDDRQKDQDIQHPLIEGLTAATIQSSSRVPPLTRITIDAPRIVSTSVESDMNQITLEITVPHTGRLNRPSPAGKLARKMIGKLVVVDAGHGGVLTGAKARVHNRVVYEKQITLSIASRLRRILEARGTRVVMTRVQDVNVPLKDRPRIANEVGATVFVSIHNDSWGKANKITGTTTYYHANSVASRKLARCIEREVAAVTGLRDRGAMSDTTLYPVGFCVLRDASMPSALCEVGFLNNQKDRLKLVDASFQQRVAEAMANGIRDYIAGGLPTVRRKKQSSAA